MTSWWKKIAEELGVVGGKGSHARRVAEHIGAQNSPGDSWEEKIANFIGPQQDVGSWARRLTPEGTVGPGSWADRIFESGILFGPSIQISSDSIAEDAIVGAAVGTLSVIRGEGGTYTFSITSDPDSKFAIDGTSLELAATLDYSVKSSHSVTIRADNGAGSVVDKTFTIGVIDVAESGVMLKLDFSSPDNQPWVFW